MSDATKVQLEYFVSKGEETLGPWTIDQIAAQLAAGEVDVTDFVYEDEVQDWVPLLECKAMKERMAKKKPKAPPPRATTQAAAPAEKVEAAIEPVSAPVSAPAMKPRISETEWFVQKGPNRYGPFTYLGLVRALQEKSVYDFDFVWKEGMETWVRVAEHEEFQPEKIRSLATEAEKGEGVFMRRQHQRLPYESEVIVHDDRSVWMGRAIEASVGGSGLMIENATLVPGQVVRLHFSSTNDLPAFNALCEIVGKQYTKEIRGTSSPVKYAVRFLKVDGLMEPQVREYFGDKQKSVAS